MKKQLAISITILFLGIAVAPLTIGTVIEKSHFPISDSNTLYVGGTGEGNYTTIQDAIDDANDGDTVFVFDDSSPYYGHVKVNKNINLIGENKDTTIIRVWENGVVIEISADGVYISGFTIQHGSISGIKIFSNYTTVTDNTIISNKWYGIYLSYSSGNIIIDNEIYDNSKGIYQEFSSDNIITGNTIITNKNYGIHLEYSSGNNITDNKIYYNDAGIYICSYNVNNIITGNNISNNDFGIWLSSSSRNNSITGNNISNNYYGIYLTSKGNNSITGNNISNNAWGVILSSCNNTIISNSFFNNGLLVTTSYDNNVEDNIVNGKPLVYLNDESDKVIDYEVGQVILVNCDNIVAENLNLSYATVGIELWRTNNSTIQNNDCSNNYYGIYSYSSSNNIITGNNISNNDAGIYLCSSCVNNIITDNNITNNNEGIYLSYSSGNNITGNNISNNWYGIYLSYSSGNNVINHNNFKENTENAYDEGNNIWDDGKYGNYWSDYKERYPNAKPKLFKPWMWNTPYEILGGNNKDMCPLIKQWPNSVSIDMPRNKATYHSLFLRLLEQYPLLEVFLSRIINPLR